MADDLESPANTDEMPFVAPCRKLPASAPWYWLSEGFEDLRKAALQSLTYGLFMAVLIMFVMIMAWQYGSAWIMFSMLCGFVFIAPLSCVGIYAISAQLERNQEVSFIRPVIHERSSNNCNQHECPGGHTSVEEVFPVRGHGAEDTGR